MREFGIAARTSTEPSKSLVAMTMGGVVVVVVGEARSAMHSAMGTAIAAAPADSNTAVAVEEVEEIEAMVEGAEAMVEKIEAMVVVAVEVTESATN